MERGRLEGELVRHHEDAWGWALTCCVWDREAAGDVLHVAYLRVLEGRARFDERSSFRTWLFGVVRRVALERRRGEGRRAALLMPLDDSGPFATSEPPPDEALEKAERARALRARLEALPERQREVLHLVFYQGMTIAQAAEVMGVGLGTARTHYERGKSRLRKELTERWTV